MITRCTTVGPGQERVQRPFGECAKPKLGPGIKLKCSKDCMYSVVCSTVGM